MPRSASHLAQIQGALHIRYRADPAQALVRKRAKTVNGASDPLHGAVVPGENYGVEWAFGVDRAVGGQHDAPNPAEMLCAALAACEHATICMISDSIGITLERLEVEVVGLVDVRGALAVDRSVHVGFSALECRVNLGVAPDADTRLGEKLRAEAERSCVNLATLRNGAPIELAWTTGESHEHRQEPPLASSSLPELAD